MDAPAPASSLIHSATLVAAGVFLVLKLRPVWIVETTATSCFEMVTLVTVAIGGMAAAAHTDMKKVLAYSTISNCGFMLYFAITSTVEAASTFFMAHGFFKACAFSTVSILIVASRHKQDYRYTGQTSISAPYLVVPAILSIGSLGSLPLSILQPIKHGTLNIALPDGTLGPVKDILLCIGLISSTLYSTKLILNIMYGQRRILKRRSQEIPNGMYDPIVAVTCFGVCTTTFLYLVHIIKTGPVELNPLVEYLPDHTPYYQHGTYVTTPTKVAYSIADKVQLLGLLCVAFPI
jgi:NADH-quinone oxidoreductase subunit L